MSQLIINTNKGSADTLKSGAAKINSNFTELYSVLSTNQISIPSLSGNNGKYLTTDGSTLSWEIVNGSGTVTSASVVSANGFAGTVATNSTTPAITIRTLVSGMIKGNGTAILAATAGTDYQAPLTLTTIGTSGAASLVGNVLNIPQYSGGGTGTGTVSNVSVISANGFTGTVATSSSTPAITIATSIIGLLKGNGTAILTATAGTDYQTPIGTISGLVKGNGANALTAAVAGTDYQTAQNVTGIVKSSGTIRSAAVAGTDYAPGTSALTTGIVKNTTITGALTIAVAGTDYQTPIGTISGLVKGNGANTLIAAVAGTDYQTPITLTTTGSSGAATFINNTLNIPQYLSAALVSRNSTSATTTSLANAAAGNITITGWKSYMLLSIQTSAAAWVTVYTSSAARTADASRTITTDPTPGSGVIAEVITTSASTQIFSPAVFGFSDESSPSTDIQVKVVNRSGSTTAITVTMKLVQLEV